MRVPYAPRGLGILVAVKTLWRDMPRLYLRHSTRRRLRTTTGVLLLSLLVACSIDLLRLLRIFSQQHARPPPKLLGIDELPSVYIASINSGASLAGPQAWRRAVESVAAHLGKAKVYVSIYEYVDYSGHRDELEQLGRNLELLGVQRSIVFANRENINDFNHTWTAQGLPAPTAATTYVRHMAEMRNRVLRPMIELALQGTRFDRILFLEDDVFSVRDP